MGSTETVNITLKQRIKNQECRTVTNDYLCDDCVLHVVREWLEQKRQKIGNETAFDAGQETLIQELLKEVSL